MKAKPRVPGQGGRASRYVGCQRGWLRPNFVAVRRDETENRTQQPGYPGDVVVSVKEV